MAISRYYLSSLDSYALEAVRVCDFIEFKRFDTGKECVFAEVEPAIPGYVFGLPFDVKEVVLAARHEGSALSDIREFPCFVHVATPRRTGLRDESVVRAADLQELAVGELYRSRRDAEGHVFDPMT